MLDLTQYKKPETAARKLYEYVCRVSKEIGQNPDIEVALWSPEESEKRGYGKAWHVCWESGPFEWAMCLTGGSDIYNGEFGTYSKPGKSINLCDSKFWTAEPYYTFSIQFWPN